MSWAWIWFGAFVACVVRSIVAALRRERRQPVLMKASYLEGKRDGYNQRAAEEARSTVSLMIDLKPIGGRRRNWMDRLG